jgi:hypothetical protein
LYAISSGSSIFETRDIGWFETLNVLRMRVQVKIYVHWWSKGFYNLSVIKMVVKFYVSRMHGKSGAFTQT